MWRSLVEVAACIHCGGALSIGDGRSAYYIESGVLTCADCNRRFEVREGIAHFGEPDDLHNCADWWSEGIPTDELFARNIRSHRQLTAENLAVSGCVDAAVECGGVIVDVATGPGSGMCGALATRLPEGAHLVLTDASAELMQGLKRCWDGVPADACLDFWLFDANRMPLRDRSVDCFTSAGGFQSVRRDRRTGGSPHGGPYREAVRALKLGGLVVDMVRVYAKESRTAAHLAEHGSIHASRETLEEFWGTVGLVVESAEQIRRGRGKSEPADGLPIDDADEWESVGYVLRKP